MVLNESEHVLFFRNLNEEIFLAPIAALFELISYVSTAWRSHAVETYEIASAESGKELLKNI